MSCAELKEEIKKTEIVKEKVSSNRGVSGRNAVRLFFWPSNGKLKLINFMIFGKKLCRTPQKIH
jgi:hypothetical protein